MPAKRASQKRPGLRRKARRPQKRQSVKRPASRARASAAPAGGRPAGARGRGSVRAKANGAAPVAAAPVKRRNPLIGRFGPYTRRLLEERKRLRQELSEMEQHQVKTEEKPVADVSGSYDDDLVDVATETFEREKGLALESGVQGILQMVEDALRRIRNGTYGMCDSCGRPIDASRLRALPYARLCIKCKEREERTRGVAR